MGSPSHTGLSAPSRCGGRGVPASPAHLHNPTRKQHPQTAACALFPQISPKTPGGVAARRVDPRRRRDLGSASVVCQRLLNESAVALNNKSFRYLDGLIRLPIIAFLMDKLLFFLPVFCSATSERIETSMASD